MRWLFVAHGSFWLVAALANGLGYAFSPRSRRVAKSLATPPALSIAAAAFAGISSLAASLLTDPALGLMLICLAPMFLLGFVQRKRMSERDDLPPPLARMFALPMNPLVQLRHPVHQARAQWAAFGPGDRGVRCGNGTRRRRKRKGRPDAAFVLDDAARLRESWLNRREHRAAGRGQQAMNSATVAPAPSRRNDVADLELLRPLPAHVRDEAVGASTASEAKDLRPSRVVSPAQLELAVHLGAVGLPARHSR